MDETSAAMAARAGSSTNTRSSTSLLVRTSGSVTWRMSTCHQRYLNLLGEQLSGIAPLHLLTDLSMWLPDGLSTADLRSLSDEHQRRLASELHMGITGLAYTVADIETAFPGVVWPIPGVMHPVSRFHNDTQTWFQTLESTLRTQGRIVTRTLRDGRRLSNLLSYFIHEPSLCLWMRSQGSMQRKGHVWVIEDDVAFLGDIRLPVILYQNNPADLVSVFAPHEYIDDLWPLYVNPHFKAVFTGKPLHKWEHVERYSLVLLRRVDQALQRGIAAYGEVFASSICSYSNWKCAHSDLRDMKLVPLDLALYSDSVPISRKQLATVLRLQSKSRSRGRWVHAVKEACHLLSIARCFRNASNVPATQSPTCTIPHVSTHSKSTDSAYHT